MRNPRERRSRFRIGKRWRGLAGAAICLTIAILFALSLPSSGEDKRLEVCVRSASIRLEPRATSPVIAKLDHGVTLTLASRVKLNRSWLYVQFESAKSGRILSGYVLETSVRRLFPVVKWTHISSEGEVRNPRQLDLTSPYLPSIEWGAGAEKIVATEGSVQEACTRAFRKTQASAANASRKGVNRRP